MSDFEISSQSILVLVIPELLAAPAERNGDSLGQTARRAELQPYKLAMWIHDVICSSELGPEPQTILTRRQLFPSPQVSSEGPAFTNDSRLQRVIDVV